MENQSFVDSVIREIVQPGVEQLMNGRFFTELRAGKLSKRRLQGFACNTIFPTMPSTRGWLFVWSRMPATRRSTTNSWAVR
jgi:hypothetical protein